MKQLDDASLVAESLTGNLEAFGQVVARYQTLICSLAYSGTGNLSQSEDLAQETFVAAWKQLAKLREPHKLRSWLCGIARNIIYDALKKQGREPSHAAASLDAIQESPAPEQQPHDFTISNEEEAILWRSLERIPEIYREPLVLFYREQQSVATVAATLDLTEDAVKQRLSRGRKLLHEQVLAFVEGALARTRPEKTFTLAVLASLPVLTFSAKAAAAGAAAKGGATAKATGAMGWLGAMLGPLIVFVPNYIAYRVTLAGAQSAEERAAVKSFIILLAGGIVLVSAMIVYLNRQDAPLTSTPVAEVAPGKTTTRPEEVAVPREEPTRAVSQDVDEPARVAAIVPASSDAKPESPASAAPPSTPGYVVSGKGRAESLNSASHGAGRAMSRKAANQNFNWKDVKRFLRERNVTLISAGLDEVPLAYKDIGEVMAAQKDLVTVLGQFDPRLVKMAPAGERPED